MFAFQARLFDEPQLALLCLESIDKQTPEALNAEGFIDIDVETLSMVLDRDSLRVKESKLFASLVKYVHNFTSALLPSSCIPIFFLDGPTRNACVKISR